MSGTKASLSDKDTDNEDQYTEGTRMLEVGFI